MKSSRIHKSASLSFSDTRVAETCVSRFAKLFLSHLEEEFKQQDTLSLRALVSDQVRRCRKTSV
jgi:glycosylphosphatidylinositol transamidase (GPIT) subunit GPI8